MNEIGAEIKLLRIISIAIYLVYISILVVISIIEYLIDKSKNIDIKDRFEEARKKDTELMLKRQGLYHKVRKDREEEYDRWKLNKKEGKTND